MMKINQYEGLYTLSGFARYIGTSRAWVSLKLKRHKALYDTSEVTFYRKGKEVPVRIVMVGDKVMLQTKN